MCGKCCKNLLNNNLYKHLHTGDGICIYFNNEKLLCNIYNERPDICNVDLSYEKYFKSIYTKEEYYELNYEGCRILNEGKR